MSFGDRDAFLGKYDRDGNVFWTRQFGTAGTDQARDVEVDEAGNVLVSGLTGGSLGSSNAGEFDAFLRQYDSSGTVGWTDQFGTTGFDDAFEVAVDADQNIVVIGRTEGSLAGTNAGSTDAFVRKVGSGGSEVWTDQIGTDEYDAALGNVVDDEGRLFVTGAVGGTLAGASAGSGDVFVRAYASTGSILWTVQYGTNAFEEAHGLVLDELGRLLTVGWTEGSLAGSNAGGADVFVRRIVR